MTRRFARWLILPLALLLLCACGRENAEPSLPPEAAGRHFAAKHALLQYRKSVDAACFAEDRLVYVTTKTERRTYTREDGKTVESEYTFQTLFSTAPSGGDAEELAAFTEYQVQCANEDALWHNVHQIAAAPDGSLRLLTTHAQEPFDARGRAVHLLILNKEGRVQSDTVFLFPALIAFRPSSATAPATPICWMLPATAPPSCWPWGRTAPSLAGSGAAFASSFRWPAAPWPL